MAGKDDPNADMREIGIYLAFAAMMAFIIWFFFSEQIKSGIRWLKIGEMYLISLFLDGDEKTFVLQNREQLITVQRYLSPLTEAQRDQFYAQNSGNEFIQGPAMLVSHYISMPIAAALVAVGMIILIFGIRKTLNRVFNIETLLAEQAKVFPVVSPAVKFNPVKSNNRKLGGAVPSVLPMMAEALSPQEWIAFNAVSIVDGKINKNEAKKAFQRQLVGRWRGASNLPPHLKALFVAFSMKVAGQREEADRFLGDVAQCWTPDGGLRLTAKLKKDIANAIKDPKIGRVTDKVAAQHAFVTPAMLRILHMAREHGGVLAPATFLWLRAVDRTCWYPLNNLGRGAFHMEAAGAMSHYKSELAANRPIPAPQVDAAIEGLQSYLNGLPSIDIPPKDYSKGKAA